MSIISKEDVAQQLFNTRGNVARLLEDELSIERGIKVEVTLKVLMKKKQGDEVIFNQRYFNCPIFTITNKHEIQIALNKADEEIKKRVGRWLSKGSGWIIEEVQQHYVNIAKYVPLRGSSYLPLPKELRHHKKGLINIKNKDNKCAIWCLVKYLNLGLGSLHRPQQKNHPERITESDREFMKGLDLSGITFPLTIKQIPIIEKRNNININAFGYEEKSVYPVYVSKADNSNHMELLYIEGEYEGEKRQHYALIKDSSRLMFNFTKHKGKKHFCMNCLQCFYSKEALVKDRINCIVINGMQAVEMPKTYIDKNGVKRIPSIYFQNHIKQLPVPFVIYADFESITEKVSGCQPSDSKSYTEKYQKHTACNFSYKVVCHYDKKYSRDLEIIAKM